MAEEEDGASTAGVVSTSGLSAASAVGGYDGTELAGGVSAVYKVISICGCELLRHHLISLRMMTEHCIDTMVRYLLWSTFLCWHVYGEA